MIGEVIILYQPIIPTESSAEFSHDNVHENCILYFGKYASSKHEVFHACVFHSRSKTKLAQVFEIWAIESSGFLGAWLDIRVIWGADNSNQNFLPVPRF